MFRRDYWELGEALFHEYLYRRYCRVNHTIGRKAFWRKLEAFWESDEEHEDPNVAFILREVYANG